MMKKIVLTGGGTAGHVMPNIALLPYLRQYFGEIVYLGSHNGIEKTLAQKHNLPFYSTDTVKLDRANLLNNLHIPLVLPKAIKQARQILSQLKPDIVYSKGGYAGFPAVMAAKHLSIPTIIHESDMSLGIANKLSKGYAKKIFLSFEDPKLQKNPKYVYAGIPIRDQVFTGNGIQAKATLNIPHNMPVILFMGGSSGAMAINNCVYKALPQLTRLGYVLHLAGKTGDLQLKAHNYKVFEYTDNIAALYAAADVVVSRAGANACAELTALGKRSIFIPLPKSASRGDQIKNANYYAKKGAAQVLLQEDMTADSLINIIKHTLASDPPRVLGFNNPNSRIAKMIAEEVGGEILTIDN